MIRHLPVMASEIYSLLAVLAIHMIIFLDVLCMIASSARKTLGLNSTLTRSLPTRLILPVEYLESRKEYKKRVS